MKFQEKTYERRLFHIKKQPSYYFRRSIKVKSSGKLNNEKGKELNYKDKIRRNYKITKQKKNFLDMRTLFLKNRASKGICYEKYPVKQGLVNCNKPESSEQEEIYDNYKVIRPFTINAYYNGKKLYHKKQKQYKSDDVGYCSSLREKKFYGEYKNHNVKQAKKEYGITQKSDNIKQEQNSSQASHSKSKLAFSMSKKQDEKNTQSLIKKLKTALSEKLFSPKETASSMKKAICLYALGILLLVTIPVLLAVAILYNSPFAMFLPTASNDETLMTVTRSYISEFNQEINELAQNPSDCETGRIAYNNYEGDSIAPSNYYDIMSVYMVRYGVGNMATIMNDTSKENLRQVFKDMCTYKTKVKTEKLEEDGKESTQKVLLIKVTLKTYRDMMEDYKFTEEEINLLETLMSPEYLSLLGATSGGGSEGGFSNEQFEAVISGLTDKDIKTVLNFALSKLDYPYSQPYRDSGKYYDCSSLMYYSWLTVGVNLSYEGANTAAQQAKLCNNLGYTVSYEEMQPGDLIFYSFGYNGRYKNVGHVAMYCGNGMLVDASYSKQKVVYRQVYSRENIVLIGRPKGK